MSEQKQDNVRILLELVKNSDNILFRDEFENPYVSIQIDGHQQIMDRKRLGLNYIYKRRIKDYKKRRSRTQKNKKGIFPLLNSK